jgi:hypothetical protein
MSKTSQKNKRKVPRVTKNKRFELVGHETSHEQKYDLIDFYRASKYKYVDRDLGGDYDELLVIDHVNKEYTYAEYGFKPYDDMEMMEFISEYPEHTLKNISLIQDIIGH